MNVMKSQKLFVAMLVATVVGLGQTAEAAVLGSNVKSEESANSFYPGPVRQIREAEKG